MNNCSFIGRLVRDPETRYAQGDQGMAITRYTIAVDRAVKREGQPTADFIMCVAFGKSGEWAGKYFRKGQRVGVTGRLETGSYKGRDGNTVYTWNIAVTGQDFADSKQESPAPCQSYAQPPAPAPAPQQQAIDPEDFVPYESEEDLPF